MLDYAGVFAPSFRRLLGQPGVERGELPRGVLFSGGRDFGDVVHEPLALLVIEQTEEIAGLGVVVIADAMIVALGVAGVKIALTPLANASSKSRLISVRTFCARR